MKTLVIVSHPYPEQSNVIKSLEQVGHDMAGITVRNLESLYGNNTSAIDVASEQAAYAGMDRVVFMFPIHWFNLTPMLKAYLNEVWSYGWAFGPEGDALKGKEMRLIVTAGASEHTYSHSGLVQSTIAEITSPMKASALYVGMSFAEPLAFYDVMDASEGKIEEFKAEVAECLAL